MAKSPSSSKVPYCGNNDVNMEPGQPLVEVPSSSESDGDVIEISDYSSEEDLEGFDEEDVVDVPADEEGFRMTSEPPRSPDEYDILNYFQSDNMTLKKGKTVELKDGDFLRIDTVLQAMTTEVFLRGCRFRRTTKMGGFVTGQPNEVCWIEEKFQDGFTNSEEIPLASVTRLRQLRLTNKAYNDFSVRTTMAWPPTNKLYKKEGILFCRIKYEVIYTSHAQKLKANSFSFVQKSIRSLYSAEVDGECWEDPANQRAARKGVPASPVERLRRSVSTVTLHGDDTARQDSHPTEYTFGDCFCGGGGMSSGAKMAGLAVRWGLDFDRQAIRTYQLNFEGASCENTSVDHFLNAAIFPPDQYHVDVLHMSPPCQSFSPAQAVKPEDYEDKQVVILAVNDLVKMVKPRIITMEETFGLLHPINREFLNSVVNSLVDQGYSVRWKVMNFGEYGVPQKRRRLVLLASGPGETLPDFPQPTHFNDFASINSVISSIPPGTPNHKPKEFEYPRRAYDGNGLLQSLIACGGGLDNYHPSGKRPFTEREFACLQTFPLDFKFTGNRTSIVKQIGNAVPPLPGKLIFEEILSSLRATDAASS